MDKWDELKLLIEADLSYTVHYSSDKQFEHNSLRRVKEWMEYLENKDCSNEGISVSDSVHVHG